ncbi:TniQ family protein [Agrobacterium burrii]|uniref:TniQ family protein n=1 Tax=Agrobacterium burrii TaxID=2815339 RepID=A0ABS3EJX9_9HYPH|nr:TniQ family protein [Agrobacterium burrii]MBO0132302.1 TniQ family protein [Agrobacterium burrii]
MKRLRTAALQPDETLTSFCSRVAAANGRLMDDLCRDIGIRTRGIVEGDRSAIEALSGFAGVAYEALSERKITKKGKLWVIGGEEFGYRSLIRTNFRFCPKCFEADQSNDAIHPRLRKYQRINWSSRFIRTCPDHHWSIADAGRQINSRLSYDTAYNLIDMRSELTKAASQSHHQEPTAFEHYVAERLKGVSNHGDFLDRQPLQIGAELCELVGMVLIHGKHCQIKERREHEWHAAGQEGFAKLKQGQAGWENILAELCASTDPSKSLLGGNVIYGTLHTSLGGSRDAAYYGKIQDEMRDFATSRLELGSETIIFRKRVPSQKMTLGRAEVEFGCHTKLIKKFMVVNGDLPRVIPPGRFTVERAAVIKAVERIKGSVKGLEAGEILGVRRGTYNVVMDECFLVPRIQSDEEISLGHYYARSDVEALLKSVMPAHPVADTSALVPLTSAAKIARVKQGDILRLLIAKKLERVGTDRALNGIGSLLLDPAEIVKKSGRQDREFLSIKEVAVRLKTAFQAVSFLVNSRYLESEIVRNPVSNALQRGILPSAYMRFRTDHVTLQDWCKEVGTPVRGKKKLMEAHGITSIIPPEVVGSRFYRRSDLERLPV